MRPGKKSVFIYIIYTWMRPGKKSVCIASILADGRAFCCQSGPPTLKTEPCVMLVLILHRRPSFFCFFDQLKYVLSFLVYWPSSLCAPVLPFSALIISYGPRRSLLTAICFSEGAAALCVWPWRFRSWCFIRFLWQEAGYLFQRSKSQSVWSGWTRRVAIGLWNQGKRIPPFHKLILSPLYWR